VSNLSGFFGNFAAEYRRFRLGSPESRLKQVKERVRRCPLPILDVSIFGFVLSRIAVAVIRAWPKRTTDEKLAEIGSQLLLLERYVVPASREGFANGRRPVSYTDIGIAALAIRRFLAATAVLTGTAGSAADLATKIDRLWSPTSGQGGDPILLLIQGQELLRKKDFEGAAAIARRSLMIQAVCIDTQRLLYDALKGRQPIGVKTIPADISLEDLSDRFCSRPFTTVVSGSEGRTFLCDCPAYLPTATGNLLYSKNAEEVWNSPVAQEIRRSVLDGDFSYCSRTLCGLLKEGRLEKKSEITDPQIREVINKRQTKLGFGPRTVQLSHDPSCNLACPSCRSEIITLKGSELATYEAARDRVVMPLLARTKGHVMVSGGGDPFASKHYRSILSTINSEKFSDLNISILTNALVLTPKQWDEFRGAHPLIKSLLVSVDAARPETYFDVRRPGRFERLLPNLEFLSERRRNGDFGLFGLCFVVQEKNFREMPEFVDLGRKLGVDLIWFQRLVNFGTFDEQGLRDADVGDPNHPHHAEFQSILADQRMRDPSVHLFTDFLQR
jgi:molybdenum cofactor biosynthesis enzyme MoaA